MRQEKKFFLTSDDSHYSLENELNTYSVSNLFVSGNNRREHTDKKNFSNKQDQKSDKPKFNCVFCRRNEHKSSQCDIVTQSLFK